MAAASAAPKAVELVEPSYEMLLSEVGPIRETEEVRAQGAGDPPVHSI